MKRIKFKTLLQQHFEAVENRWPLDGYYCKTRQGSEVKINEDGEFWHLAGGNDVRIAVLRVLKVVFDGKPVPLRLESPEELAAMITLGRSIGIEAEACAVKGWIWDTPPPVVPESSGSHGMQGLDWKDEDLRAAGLLGHGYGEGIRIGATWETGAPLRYAGPSAENSIIGFGAPGTGKGTSFQISGILESCGTRGDDGERLAMSTVTIDPSGQLYAVCREWLEKCGVRVLPIMPFTEGFPARITKLGSTRGMNIMDLLKPDSESFQADCAQIGQALRPEEKSTGGDPFFALSGRNLITMLIGCVKLYSHPSEQNLSEVFHKLGDLFNYARSIIGEPGMPRWIKTQLQRFTAPGAETNKTILSIVETALAELAWLGDEAIERVVRESSFQWDDVKNGSRPLAIFFLLPVSKLQSHRAFLTLCANAALMGLGASERGKRKVLFTIDEAGICGHLPIQTAYAESRKRGVAMSVWFQNVPQAAGIYGDRGAWKNLLSGADLHIFLCPPRDPETAKFICDQIGTTTELWPHVSYSPDARTGQTRANTGFSEHGRPVLFPQELMGWPKSGPLRISKAGTAAIMFAPGRSRNALKIWARPYFDDPELKDKGGLDPYHAHLSDKERER